MLVISLFGRRRSSSGYTDHMENSSLPFQSREAAGTRVGGAPTCRATMRQEEGGAKLIWRRRPLENLSSTFHQLAPLFATYSPQNKSSQA